MEEKNILGALCAVLEYFHEKKTPSVSRDMRHFYKIILSNIMKHGKNYVERQISIQGIHLSALWNYFEKKEESSNEQLFLP